MVLFNGHGPQEQHNVPQKGADGHCHEIPEPKMVPDYQNNMKGVDLCVIKWLVTTCLITDQINGGAIYFSSFCQCPFTLPIFWLKKAILDLPGRNGQT